LQNNKTLQSAEQEKYTSSPALQRAGLVETGTKAVVEWAWEQMGKRSFPCERISRTRSERPPLCRTGYSLVAFLV